MNSVTMEKFLSDIRNYHILTPKQQNNVVKLNSISKLFSSRAKIKFPDFNSYLSESVVIDSGHQPNFFPYPGLWKKAFLLGKIQKTLSDTGVNTIAFFGFADQNLSTAKILSKNQIPYWNKKGSENIGFRIEEKEHFKSFCTIQKPHRDRWIKEINKIEEIYRQDVNKKITDQSAKKNTIDDIIKILWESYEIAHTFSELNSIIFAKICYEILGIDSIRFYSFSDLNREKIFLDESKEIILQQDAFNNIFNSTIAKKKIKLRTVTLDRIPFWYQCGCGGKLDLIVSQPGIWTGLCPICKKESHLDIGTNLERLDAFYSHMDFSAVARNIVFASGMGSSLFISGSGGALSYGTISDEISKELGFYRSLRLSWISRDYYIGRFHALAIRELMKTYHLELSEILDGSFKEKISSHISEADIKIKNAKKRYDTEKTIKNLENTRFNLVNLTMSASHLFQINPSLIDLLENINAHTIVNNWNNAVENAMLEFDGVGYKINKEIIHPTHLLNEVKYDDIPTYYKQIESIEVK
jgi:hypothetical protein